MAFTKRALVCSLSSFLVACGSPSGWDFDTSDAGPPGSGSHSGSDAGGSGGSHPGSGSVDSGGVGAGNGDGAADGATPGGGDDAGTGDPGDFNTPPQCSSNKQWLLGDTKSPEMHPGVACDTCHKVLGTATAFPFDIAGTVYPTAHEPDDCYGATGATVVITDAIKQDHTLAVNAAGNFYNLDYVIIGAIATPYTAKVVFNGKERPMITPQTNGDCNSCHSQQGTQSALGRILLP